MLCKRNAERFVRFVLTLVATRYMFVATQFIESMILAPKKGGGGNYERRGVQVLTPFRSLAQIALRVYSDSFSNLHFNGVLLRRAGRAAAVGDVFVEEGREAFDDVGVLVVQVRFLADVVAEIEELDWR